VAFPNVQSNIQTIAQANSPFIANNGNPGTVYNMPNTGSYKPPMASALNQWALNPMATGAAATPFWQLPQQQPNGGGNPFFVIPPLTVTPPTTPTTQPPVVQPPVTPTVTPPLTAPTPPTSVVSGAGGTGGATGTGTRGPLYNGLTGLPADFGLSDMYNKGQINFGNNAGEFASKLGGALDNIAERFSGPDGVDFKQVLDSLTEPFIQGDMYNEMLGTANWPNMVKGVLNLVVPGVGSVADFIASKIPEGAGGILGKVRDFFTKGDRQDAFDNLYRSMNDSANMGGDVYNNPYNSGYQSNYLNFTDLNNLNKPGATVPGRWVQVVTGADGAVSNQWIPGSDGAGPPTTSNPFNNNTGGGGNGWRMDVPDASTSAVTNVAGGGVFGSQGTGGSGAMEVLGSRMKNPTLDRLLTQAR